MLENLFEGLIQSLNSYPAEILAVFTYLVSMAGIVFFWRSFGKSGLYVSMCLAVIVANMQVLNGGIFFPLNHPIAMGTTVFASCFLISDLLTEYYGVEAAKEALWMSFAAQVLVIVLMILNLGVAPIKSVSSDYQHFVEARRAITLLFTPSLSIFMASLISYLLSQRLDIWVFARLKAATQGRLLGMRAFISLSCSALLDSAVFSVLAWVIFRREAVSWDVLIFSYILGTFVFRLFNIIANTAFMSVSPRLQPKI